MATIRQVATNVKQLDLAKEAMGVVVDMKPDMLRLNKEQLLEGRVKDGGKFQERYKSPLYAKMKYDMNPMAGLGVPDLYKTGAFFDAMRLDVLSKMSFNITSTDWKTATLVKRFGSTVSFFGLNKESIKELVNTGFEKQLLERVHSVTKL